MKNATSTAKRTMRNPEKFVGKRIDRTKWILPEDFDLEYAVCAYTGQVFRQREGDSFPDFLFERSWLKANGLCVEAAEWLSAEGYELMISKIALLGLDINEAWEAHWAGSSYPAAA